VRPRIPPHREPIESRLSEQQPRAFGTGFVSAALWSARVAVTHEPQYVQGDVNVSELSPQTSEPVLPGEAGPRITAAIAWHLIAELPLAIRAAQQLRRRPGIALAVVFLASFAFLSNLLSTEIMAARGVYPTSLRDLYLRSLETRPRLSFFERWLAKYERPGLALFFGPLGSFQSPLAPSERLADGWMRLLVVPVALRAFPTRSEPASPRIPGIALSWLSVLLMVAVHILVFVALVGSMLSSATRVTSDTIRQSWRAHYWPVFAVAFIGFVAVNSLQSSYVWLWPRVSDLPFADGLDTVVRVVVAAVAIALMLAPFAIMTRGVGWRRGILDGLSLLRRRWLALVTLFVLYRIGYEVVSVWRLLSPWPIERRALTLTIPAPVVWVWVGEIGFALLGLWVAYAFVEIARGPVPAPAGDCG
jgi:hypothetical protein